MFVVVTAPAGAGLESYSPSLLTFSEIITPGMGVITVRDLSVSLRPGN